MMGVTLIVRDSAGLPGWRALLAILATLSSVPCVNLDGWVDFGRVS